MQMVKYEMVFNHHTHSHTQIKNRKKDRVRRKSKKSRNLALGELLFFQLKKNIKDLVKGVVCLAKVVKADPVVNNQHYWKQAAREQGGMKRKGYNDNHPLCLLVLWYRSCRGRGVTAA